MHALLILLYAIAGTVSFITGLLVIKQKRTGWLFNVYLWSMVAMTAALITALVWDWSVFALQTIIIYIVLCLLALFTNYRGFMANDKQFHRYTGWWLEFMDDVGFTVVSVFIILLVVGAIDLVLPVWAIILMAIVGAFAGRLWLQYEKDHYIERRAERKEKAIKSGKKFID